MKPTIVSRPGLPDLLDTEEKFILEEQIQRGKIMASINTDNLLFTLLTQFTYVSLYHGVLPLSSFFLLLANLAITGMTERLYSNITQRNLSEEIGGLGLWNTVFEIVGLLSIIGSAFITTYTTPSLDFYTKNKELALLIIIAA